MKNYAAEQLEASYQRTRRQAAKQTNLLIAQFPAACPYPLTLVLDDDWLLNAGDRLPPSGSSQF